MNRSAQSRLRCWLLLAAAWLVVGGSMAPARAQLVTRRLTLEELTRDAEAIVVAKCVSRETFYRNGNIISRYRMKPSSFWKGQLQLSSAGEFALEQVGGELEHPLPVAQYDPMSVELSEDQQVLLFLSFPDPALANDPMISPPEIPLDQPRIVGAREGAFSVIRHPETGRLLVNPRVSSGKPDPRALERQVKRAEQTAAAEKSLATNSEQAEAATPRVRPFEPLAELERQVKSLVSQQKEEAGSK